VLGRYSLHERLGAGGFGTVYAGHDERLDRPVAVKVIPAGTRTPERARREALAAARLDHPGVVAVFDAGEDGDARYLVSELVRGRTLDRLHEDGALSDRDVVRVGLALADALEHAHARGVVHRDVKPQNVIVPDSPREARAVAKLADFGVAHLAGDEPLTRTGEVVGTLAYMAPEQAAGRRVGPATDLYSLALVIYEGLAGSNPVRGGSPAATAKRLGTVLPSLRRARRDLPPELTAALDRALRPRPEERGTLAELSDVLLDALPEVSDDGGTIAPHPLEGVGIPVLPGWAARTAAAAAAGALAAAGRRRWPRRERWWALLDALPSWWARPVAAAFAARSLLPAAALTAVPVALGAALTSLVAATLGFPQLTPARVWAAAGLTLIVALASPLPFDLGVTEGASVVAYGWAAVPPPAALAISLLGRISYTTISLLLAAAAVWLLRDELA
jgi:hypothetical protein